MATKRMLKRLRRDLVDRHGRRPYYRPHQVETVLRQSDFASRIELYLAYAVFCHRTEFDKVAVDSAYSGSYQDLRAPYFTSDRLGASAEHWDAGFVSGLGGGDGADGGAGGDGGGGD